jgi:Tfp pilus assembly protein PilF
MPHSSSARFFATAFLYLAVSVLGGCAMTGSPLIDETGGLAQEAPVRLPEPAVLAVAKGEAFLASRQYRAAYDKFTVAVQNEPENHQARLGLAEAQLGLRQLVEALAGFEAAMDSEHLQARALQGRGITLALMGRDTLALPLLRQAVERDAALWRAWNTLGRSYALKGDTARALVSYDRALLANPQAAPVHNNRGMALISAMRYVEAEESFRQALAAQPDLPIAMMNLRLAIAWQGRYEEAIADLKRGEAPRVLNNIGFVAMERGDYATAKLFFTKAMEISPSYYPTAARNLEELKDRKKVAVSTDSLS